MFRRLRPGRRALEQGERAIFGWRGRREDLEDTACSWGLGDLVPYFCVDFTSSVSESSGGGVGIPR